MPRATAFVHTSSVAYLPSYDGSHYFFKATTAVNTAQRLGDLITVPSVPDETYLASMANSPTGKHSPAARPPFHFFVQVAMAAGNTVTMTWDNVTTPVVGGPGMEMEQGVVYEFENAGEVLLKGGYQMLNGVNQTPRYVVNAKTAFQFIAIAATDLNLWFSD